MDIEVGLAKNGCNGAPPCEYYLKPDFVCVCLLWKFNIYILHGNGIMTFCGLCLLSDKREGEGGGTYNRRDIIIMAEVKL